MSRNNYANVFEKDLPCKERFQELARLEPYSIALLRSARKGTGLYEAKRRIARALYAEFKNISSIGRVMNVDPSSIRNRVGL